MSFFPEIKLKGMTSFMDFMTTKKTSFPDKSFIQLLPPFAFMKIYVQVSCSTKQVNYCHSALHLLHEPAIFVICVADVEEEPVREHFEDCGDVEGVRIIRDRQTGLGKGFGFVLFKVFSFCFTQNTRYI